jgi:hypothetical protein
VVLLLSSETFGSVSVKGWRWRTTSTIHLVVGTLSS